MSTIRLSLISHTNVGKTTLARTLLRRDVGEVRDEAHVTDAAERFPLVETGTGDLLELWDTPGFGDSARLLRRLQRDGSALGWFLSQVWDRWADRPFFSSQQAIRNVRDSADVVLYLVNAGEDPVAAAYVDAEMQILEWVGKPVVVLLNQLGPPRPAEAEDTDVARWRAQLARCAIVRDVLAFDAFARCWIQELALFDAVAAALPTAARPAFARLSDAWQARNLAVFEQAATVLAGCVAQTALDRAEVPQRSLGERARGWLRGLATDQPRADPALEAAMLALAQRLDARLGAATCELLRLHGLDGRAASDIARRMGADFAVVAAADVAGTGVVAGLVSGALGGLAADVAAGGLTFGAGALIGAVLGAAGASGLARAYNLARGADATVVRWSPGCLTGRVTGATLRYLAVAHFGRGRGDFVASEYPPHWRGVVDMVVARHEGALSAAWQAAAADASGTTVENSLRATMVAILRDTLGALYPRCAWPRESGSPGRLGGTPGP